MSSISQHKLFNHEVVPPSSVWEKIAVELNGAALEFQFQSRLNDYSVDPSAAVWEKISGQLDESALLKDYTNKLYDFEVAPPTGTWTKVKSAITFEAADTIQKRKKVFPLFLKAVAAVLIGILAWGGIQLLNNKPGKEVITVKGNDKPEEIVVQSATDQKINLLEESAIATVIAESDEARNDAALEASKKTYAKLDIRTNKNIKEVANFYFGEPVLTGIARGIEINNPQTITEPDIVDNTTNRYFLLMTPDGNIIRMSKKLAGMVCCVSGEEQDEVCKDQLKKWRTKMANTQKGHSPGNLMDILSLLNSLQEDY